MWISEEYEREAEMILKEWEKQGCTYEEVETKIAALSSRLNHTRKQMGKEQFKLRPLIPDGKA